MPYIDKIQKNNVIYDIHDNRTEYLFKQIPTKVEEGNLIYINDSTDLPLKKFVLKGKTEQGENPSPTNPQEIVNVEGTIAIKKCNKNLFDYIKASNTNNTEVTQYRIFEIDGLIPNTQYNINNMKFTQPLGDKYCYLWNAKTYSDATAKYGIAGITTYDTHISFMSNSEGKIYLAIYPTDVSTWNNVIAYLENAQIEKGLIATEYIPHQSKTYNFPLSQGQKLMQGDYLAEDGIHHVRTQVLLNGTETWWENTNYSTDEMLVANTILDGMKSGTEQILCSIAKYANPTVINSIRSMGTIVGIGVDRSQFPTIASFKTWLSTHNVTVEYELAEETMESYTQEQKAVYDEIIKDGTYDRVTNYNTTANINPDMIIEYRRDLKTVIDNIESRLTLLE